MNHFILAQELTKTITSEKRQVEVTGKELKRQKFSFNYHTPAVTLCFGKNTQFVACANSSAV